MREGFQNWLIVFSIIVVSGIIVYFALPKKQEEENQDVMGVETVDYKYVPYITSIPPISIKVDDNFEYEIKVSDLDSLAEEIEVYLTQKPSWMYIEEDMIKGIPLQADTYKFIVTASDGSNSSSQVNYLLVEENE